MDLPPHLLDQFRHLESAATEQELLELLSKNPHELLHFFENIVEYYSWSDKHPNFIKGAISWFTEKFIQDQLFMEDAQKIAKILQEHYSSLDRYIVTDLTLDFGAESTQMNSLLFGSSSDFFRQRLIDECGEGKKRTLKIQDATHDEFVSIEEFMETGSTWKLYKKSNDALINNLNLAEKWGMEPLVLAIQDSLTRYIDSSNAIDLLKMSNKKRWELLKKQCMEFINMEGYGIRLLDIGPGLLSLEFLEFSEKSLGLFDDLKDTITHLTMTGVLPLDVMFRQVVNNCPKLLGIDIAHSSSYSEHLKYMPVTLQELDVSKCGWLNQGSLKEIIQTCPRLNKLNICSNSQLNYNSWSELQKWRDLKWLDVGRSHQMQNEDFKIILKACPGVTDFNVEDCDKVSEDTFFVIGRSLPKIMRLNVSRTNISDSSLIEIATRCRALVKLDLSRCSNLSSKGILQTVRETPQLRELNLEKVNITKEALEEIRGVVPELKIHLDEV